MSAAKFTAAKWEVRPLNHGTSTRENCVEPLWVGVGNKKICRISDLQHANATEEEIANAKLIAASPRMYAALVKSLRFITDDDAANEVKAAIQLATE